MKSTALKIKSLAIDILVILGLVIAAIVLATHSFNTKLPSLF